MLFIVVVLVLVVLMFGWIIEYLNILDYEGWCWFFVIEGIFIVFFGILIFYLLFDSLEKVKWFMLQQILVLVNKLCIDNEIVVVLNKNINLFFFFVIKNLVLFQFFFVYMLIQVVVLVVNYWLLGLVKGFLVDFMDIDVGLIMSILFIFVMFSMFWWGWYFDKKNE